MSEPALRLGMIGCGAVAEQYHLPAVDASEAVDLVALVDPALDRARALAARYGAAHVTTDASEVADLIDLAIVATPNHLHAGITCDLLRRGVHVLVEKPLARTIAECEEIASCADSTGAVVAVGHDFRRFPVAAAARELLESGVIGAVEHVDLRQSATGRWPYATTYAFSKEQSGGGVLIDFGVHMLDLLCWWLGDARVVGYRDDAAGGVETECEVDLEFAHGIRGSMLLTRLSEMRDTSVVRGDRGTLEIGIFEPALIRLTPHGGATLEGDIADRDFASAPMRTVFKRQIDDFAEAVRTGRPPLVTVDDGTRAVRLVEGCYAARQPLRRPWDWPEALSVVQAATR